MSNKPTAVILAAIDPLRDDGTQLRGEMIARIDGLRGDVTQPRDDVTQLRCDRVNRADMTLLRVDVMDRINRLQNTVARIRDDVFVNLGNAERVERIARAAKRCR